MKKWMKWVSGAAAMLVVLFLVFAVGRWTKSSAPPAEKPNVEAKAEPKKEPAKPVKAKKTKKPKAPKASAPATPASAPAVPVAAPAPATPAPAPIAPVKPEPSVSQNTATNGTASGGDSMVVSKTVNVSATGKGVYLVPDAIRALNEGSRSPDEVGRDNAEAKAADDLKALQDAEARSKTAEAQVKNLNAEIGSLKEEMVSASAKVKDLARNVANDNPFCSRDQLKEAMVVFQNLAKELREKMGLLDKTTDSLNRIRADYATAFEAAKAAKVDVGAFECPVADSATPPRGRFGRR